MGKSSTWVKITVGSTESQLFQLTNRGISTLSGKMHTQKMDIKIDVLRDVLLKFNFYEGDTEDSLKSLRQESLTIELETGCGIYVDRFISSITKSSFVKQRRLDIFFNDNIGGIWIGLLINGYKSTKYIYKLDTNSQTESSVVDCSDVASEDVMGTPSDKDVFISNIKEFASLLNVTSLSEEDLMALWAKTIESLPNSSKLKKTFESCSGNLNYWINLLKSWGLKRDTCKRYPGSLVDESRYSIEDSSLIDDLGSYDVIEPCWTIWFEENNVRKEIVVTQGVLHNGSK